MKLLIAVDGSESSTRAVGHVVKRIRLCSASEPFEVHLLNVQAPLTSSSSRFIDADDIREYHREQGARALDTARATLDAASVSYRTHIDVGTPAQVIDRYARELGVDEIVMGTRGHGTLANILLGSTSRDLLHLTSVPLVLVK